MSEKKPTDIELDMIESRLEEANAGKNIRATAMDTATLKGLLAESSQGEWVAVETGSEKYMAWIGIGTAKDRDTVALVDNRKIEIGTVDVDEANANANLICALRNNAEELIASAERVARLEAALRMTEFGFNHRRCPVCAGFNVGPNGETDKVHTKTCPVGQALGGAKLYAAPSREQTDEQGRPMTYWGGMKAPSRETDQRGTNEAENSGGQSLKSGVAGDSGDRPATIANHPDRVATTHFVPHPTAEPALSAEQIDDLRGALSHDADKWPSQRGVEYVNSLCDMALSSLTARDEGIEAAAKVCDEMQFWKLAEGIRALKGGQP